MGSAAFLLTACARDNVVVRYAATAPIEPALMKREPGLSCLPDQDDYGVDEIDDARLCERAGRLRARGRLHALQDAVTRRDAVQQQVVEAQR